MALYKLEDFDPQYRDAFDNKDIKGLGVYTQGTNEKIGSVSDVLVDEEGHFRYLVVDLGFWIFGKKVLLPVGKTRIDYTNDRVYTIGLSREQAENLPEFNESLVVDYDYEEQVRGVYRTPQVESPASVESPTPVERSVATTPTTPTTPTYNRDTYTYQQEPDLYNLNQRDHETLTLYQERLIANKRRRKVGEVTVGKHIETETERISVPVDREQVVIERVTPTGGGRTVSPGEADFREGEVARMEIHEETPEVHKEAFVREEVRVKKVVEHETAEAQGTVRREELDINAPGLPVEER